MIFRLIRRAVALVLALAFSIFRYWLIRLRGPVSLERRALWGQQTARAILHGFNLIHMSGNTSPNPHRGRFQFGSKAIISRSLSQDNRASLSRPSLQRDS